MSVKIEKVFLVTASPSYFRRSELVFWYMVNLFTGKSLSPSDYEDDRTHKLLFMVANGGNIYERPNLRSFYPQYSTIEDFERLEASTDVKNEDCKDTKTTTSDDKTKFIVSKDTIAINMSTKYRVVISIDTSPSMGLLDLKTGKVVFSNVYPALDNILTSLMEPIILRSSSGTGMKLNPEVYISVIAQSNVQSTAAVLVQGLLVTQDNLSSILKLLYSKIKELEKLATISYREEMLRASTQMFDDEQNRNSEEMDMQAIIQHAWLNLTLLPTDASPRIILLTDGVTPLNDYSSFDNILMRLNREEIPISIVQLRKFSSHCRLGYIPDTELLKFLVKKTGGIYLDNDSLKDIQASCCSGDVRRNILQQKFFFQQFSLDLNGSSFCSVHANHLIYNDSLEIPLNNDLVNFIDRHYESVKTFPWEENSLPPPVGMITKKQIEYPLEVDIYSLIDIRINEGFTATESEMQMSSYSSKEIMLKLVYEWEPNVRIIYQIESFKLTQNSGKPTGSKISIFIESYFELLKQWNKFQTFFQIGKPYNQKYSFLKKLHLFLVTLKDVDEQLNNIMNVCKYSLKDKLKSKLSIAEKTQQIKVLSKILRGIKNRGWYRWFKIYQLHIILVENRLCSTESESSTSTVSPPHSPQSSNSNSVTLKFNGGNYTISLSRLLSVLSNWSTLKLSFPENTYVLIFARSGLFTFPTFCVLRVYFNTPSLVELRFHFFCCTSEQRLIAMEGMKKQLREIGGCRLSQHLLPSKIIKSESNPDLFLSSSDNNNNNINLTNINSPPLYYDTKPLYRLIVQYKEISSGNNSQTSRIDSSLPLHLHKPINTLSQYMLHKRIVWRIENRSTMKTIIDMILQIRLKEGFLRINNRKSSIHTFMAQVPLQKGRDQLACTFEYLLYKYSPNLIVTEFWMEPQYGLSDGEDLNLPENIFNRYVKSLAAVDKRIIISMWTFYKLKNMDTSNISDTHSRRNSSIHVSIDGQEIITPYLCICSILSSAISTIQQYDIFSENYNNMDKDSISSSSSSNNDTSNQFSLSLSNEILATMLEDELHSLSDCEVDTKSTDWHTLIVKSTRQRCRCFVKIISTGVILAIVPMLNQIEPNQVGNIIEDVLDFGEIERKFTVAFFECSHSQLLQDSLQYKFNISQLCGSKEEGGKENEFKIEKNGYQTEQHHCITLSDSSLDTSPFSAATKQYYFSLRYAYEHSFAKGIYTNIKEKLQFHPVEFQKAIDYCREYPVEIDITQYFRILQKSSRLGSVSEYVHELFDGYMSPLFSLIEGTRYYYYSATEENNNVYIDDSSEEESEDSEDYIYWDNNINIINENEQMAALLKEDQTILHSKTVMGVYPYPFFLSLECQLEYTNNGVNQVSTMPINTVPTFETISDFLGVDATSLTYSKVFLRMIRITLSRNSNSLAMKSVMERLQDNIQALISKEILSALMGVLPITMPLLAIVTFNLRRLTSSKKTQFSYPLYLLDSDLGESLLIDELEKFFFLPLKRLGDLLFVISPNNNNNDNNTETSNSSSLNNNTNDYTVPYWLILSHSGTTIQISFFSQTLSKVERSRILSSVRACMRTFSDRINQLILLKQLHDTHHCSDLLVPQQTSSISNDKLSSTSQESSTPRKSRFFNHFQGQFECNLVHSIQFLLHSRVSGAVAYSELINSSLNLFQVHNRRGLFVYQDQEKNVFYMKLYLGGGTNQENLSKVSTLNLDIFGLDPPGEEITEQLRRSLEDKLASVTVFVISEILMRNPKLKLTNEDLHFLYTSSAAHVSESRFELDSILSPTMYLFLSHLMQTLTQHFIHCNLTSNAQPLAAVLAEDTVEPNMLSLDSLNFKFIYNYTQNFQSIAAIVGPGLCFIRVYLCKKGSNEVIQYLPPSEQNLNASREDWSKLCESLWNNENNIGDNFEYSLLFRCWNHSVVPQNMDKLHEQLILCSKKTVVEHALECHFFVSKDSNDTIISNDIASHRQGFYYAHAIQSSGVSRSFLTMNNLPSWSVVSFLIELLFILEQTCSGTKPLLFFSHKSNPNKLQIIRDLTEFQMEYPLKPHTKTDYNFFICYGTINLDPGNVPTHLKLYPTQISGDVSGSSNDILKETSLIPRKWFSIIKVTATTLSFSSYNWSSSVKEEVHSSVTRLLNWNDIRMHLLLSISHQKMGLLRHVPSGINPPSSYAVSSNIYQGMDNLGTEKYRVPLFPTTNNQRFSANLPQQNQAVSFSLENIDLLLNNKFPERKSNLPQSGWSSNNVNTQQNSITEEENLILERRKQLLRFSPGFENVYRDNTANIFLHGEREDHLKSHAHQFMETAFELCQKRKLNYFRKQMVNTITNQTANSNSKSSVIAVPNLQRLLANSIFIHACRAPFLLLELTTEADSAYYEKKLFAKFLHAYSIFLEGLGVSRIDISTEEFYLFYKSISGGVLIIEMSLRERMICTNLYAHRNVSIHRTADSLSRPNGINLEDCEERRFYEDSTEFKRLLHINSFLYDYQLFLSSSVVPLVPRQGSLVVPLFLTLRKQFPTKPKYARNILLDSKWKFPMQATEYGDSFFKFIMSNAQRCSFQLISKPSHKPGGSPSLRLQWSESLMDEGNEQVLVSITLTRMKSDIENQQVIFDYFVARVHPSKFLLSDAKIQSSNTFDKQQHELSKVAENKLKIIIKDLYSFFIGGMIWDRLLKNPALVITIKEKEELLKACEITDIKDLDPSLFRLASLQVPTQSLVHSLQKVYPSRIRFLTSDGDGKQEFLIIREKQMLYIINDEIKNSFSIFSCLRKPLCSDELDSLQLNAIQQCSQLISHLCYILWSSCLK